MSDYFMASRDARQEEEDEEARILRRQRRLRRILKKQGDEPSFSALLLADLDKDDSDDEGDDEDYDEEKRVGHAQPLPMMKTNRPQKHILIDIDFELGLKDAPGPLPEDLLEKPVPTVLPIPRPTRQPSSAAAAAASMVASKRHPAIAAGHHPMLPQDEGWYEGVVSPMAFPTEDAQYLSELHCFTRENVELFSVMPHDEVKMSFLFGQQRRTVVRGRVGVRCIHCAAAFVASATASNAAPVLPNNSQSTTRNAELKPPPSAEAAASSSPPPPVNPSISPGAVAFPVNIKGLHTACSQKLQVHLEQCPNLPVNKRAQLQSIMQSKSLSIDETTGRSTKRLKTGGITGALYYMISAKRIGLLDANNDSGIRFGRDLAMEPYPMEAIRAQIEDAIDLTGETAGASATATAASAGPRITADEESERVLAAAIMEQDDPDRILGMSADKAYVTDFIFLAIRQMAICHALPADFASRGKKTKLMRVGFAGFCCRHCNAQQQPPNNINTMRTDYSCRSFASAADNLSSAISNSFASHLLKCPNVPVQIKKALSAYKKIHPRQMAQLPYGSQRRLFLSLFSRLRSKDKSAEEIQSIMVRGTPPPPEATTEAHPILLPRFHDLATVETYSDDVAETGSVTQSTRLVGASADEPMVGATPADYPLCDEAETKALLIDAEENWDPAVNDYLIRPEDRQLVSDYIFLTMRHMKKAIPTAADAMRIRRSSANSVLNPGICCIHCFERDEFVSPSGRSFPSAADNFASAFNSSLYNHMQSCTFVPVNVKRALANLRKIHSAQCSKKFGAQRRYFNILYGRLLPATAQVTDQREPSAAPASPSPRHTLSSLGFLELPTAGRTGCQLTLCSRCRMVPVQFRARGAFFTERPSLSRAKDHYLNCKGSKLDLTLARDTLQAAATALGVTATELVQRDSFKGLVSAAVHGHKDLCRTFSLDILLTRDEEESDDPGELWKAFPDSADFESVQAAFQVLARELEDCSTDLRLHPELLAYILLIAPGMRVPDTTTTEMSTLT